MNARIPVLEVGGSHICAAWVDTRHWAVVEEALAATLSPSSPAGTIIDVMAQCADQLGDLGDRPLGVAIPGPFDYTAGVGRFAGVGKFESLNNVDVGARLRTRLRSTPTRVAFVNDAVAFALGEWINGAASGAHRAVALTLGTGVGSAFIADGAVVTDGPSVPPDGFVYRLQPDGIPLEDRVSTRAIIRAYGRNCRGVLDVMDAAEHGDEHAAAVLDDAFIFLGVAVAPWLRSFGAEVTVVGGKIAEAWGQIAPRLSLGLQRGGIHVPLRHAANPATSGLVGAAFHVTQAVPAIPHQSGVGEDDSRGPASTRDRET